MRCQNAFEPFTSSAQYLFASAMFSFGMQHEGVHRALAAEHVELAVDHLPLLTSPPHGTPYTMPLVQ